jgi:hypothetical protein
MKQIPYHAKEKGQSLVEMAVSITVLFILLAGIVDISRLAYYYMTMQDAAQEGMVYGVVYPTHCHQMEDRVRSALAGDTSIEVKVFVDNVDCFGASQPVNACSGKELRIEVTQPDFPLTMPFLGSFLNKQSLLLTIVERGTILRPLCTP